MGRLERQIFRLNDQIAGLRRDEELVTEELAFHRHIHDDARRDAIVSNHPFDRADARETEGDVVRFESVIEALRERRARLEAKRDRLLRRLG
jgi:hypothetical protein